MFAVALAFRLLLLHQVAWMGHGDEATAGLMARHISQGRDFPVFFYGQHYFGALQAWLVAPLLWLPGMSLLVAYKLVPALESALLPALVWWYASKAFNRRVGLSAALILLCPPAVWAMLGLQAMVGYQEGGLFGITLFMLSRHVREHNPERLGRILFMMGVMAGLGLWVNQHIVCYLVPVFLGLWAWDSRMPLRGWAWCGVAGTCLGLAPVWLHALWYGREMWEFYTALGHHGQSRSWWECLSDLVMLCWPAMLGCRLPWQLDRPLGLWGMDCVTPWLAGLAVASFVGAYSWRLFFFAGAQHESAPSLRSSCAPISILPEGTLIVIALAAALLTYLHWFGQFVIVRYFAAAFPLVAMMLAWGIDRLIGAGDWKRVALAVIAFCPYMITTVGSYWAAPLTDFFTPQEYISAGRLLPSSQGDVIKTLDQRHLDRLYAWDWWLGNPIMLSSEERIIVGDSSKRYPRYNEEVKNAARVGYLFHAQGPLHAFWDEFFAVAAYEKIEVGSLVVYAPACAAPPKSTWKVSATRCFDERMSDVDLVDSFWWCNTPRAAGQKNIIEFGEALTVNRIAFLNRNVDDPTGPGFTGPAGGVVRFATTENAWGPDFALEQGPGWTATPRQCAGMRARYVCVEQTQSAPAGFWYVGEILLSTLP